jgi:hypothetical protein
MDRSEWRRSILDYLRARAGKPDAPFGVSDIQYFNELQPAPRAPAKAALIDDALEELATEGFIERHGDGSYTLTPKGGEQLNPR